MTKLLITAIGGDISQATASIIREAHPDWTLFGIDQETRHAGARYVDHLSASRPAREAGYLAWLAGFIADSGIDYCLPMSEAELSVLAAQGQDRVGDCRLLWAGCKMISIGCDKLATAEFLRSIGVPGPWTLAATEEAAPPSFPCIFKLRRSAGSKAVFVCQSAEEVHFFRRRYPDAVLQELLPDADREVTCAVYRTAQGTTYVLQLLRRLAGGFTSWAQVIDVPEITLQCRAVAEAVDLKGAINVQLRITAEGPRIFEINPRLSSTVLMRHLIGYTDVKWMLDEALGRAVETHLPKPGTTMARTQGAAILPTNNA
jgi:carbamoyl-phosphate synthase large subunit